MTASFILEIDESASTASAKVFRPNSGTVTWSSFAFDGVCTTTAGPQIEALRPEDGALNFFLDDTGSTIDAEGVMYRPPPAATFHTHCNDYGDGQDRHPAVPQRVELHEVTRGGPAMRARRNPASWPDR